MCVCVCFRLKLYCVFEIAPCWLGTNHCVVEALAPSSGMLARITGLGTMPQTIVILIFKFFILRVHCKPLKSVNTILLESVNSEDLNRNSVTLIRRLKLSPAGCSQNVCSFSLCARIGKLNARLVLQGNCN